MVYSQKFVMAILLNWVPQTELGNSVVKLPFGSNYSIRLRNKQNRRAVAKIYIDNENVSGPGYIVGANSFVDIHRHHDKDSGFKFVSLDSPEAFDFGKNGPNDDKTKGVVEARFHLEKEIIPTVHHHHHYVQPSNLPWWSKPYRPNWPGGTDQWQTKGITGPTTYGSTNLTACNNISPGISYNTPTSVGTPPVLRDGCTVEGVQTGQHFFNTYIDYETDYVSLKVFLQGFDRQVEVATTKPMKKHNKLHDLEKENEELRQKLAEIENATLKKKLAEIK